MEGVIDATLVDEFFPWGGILGVLDGDKIVEKDENIDIPSFQPMPDGV